MKKYFVYRTGEILERILMAEGSQFERWEWRIKGTGIRHHPHEPAIQHKNGDWAWYRMDREHRWDGPSAFWRGRYEWWIHGRELSYEEWERDPDRLEWLREQSTSI